MLSEIFYEYLYESAGTEKAMDTGDTTQAPYPHIDRYRLKLSDTYRSSYAECR
jgi:hypothetical protein